MRPRTLDDFVGQSTSSARRLLRRAIQADQLQPDLLWPPARQDDTAQVIANTTRAHFIALNAVLSGVQGNPRAVATAQEYARKLQRRTILFVDECTASNKAQQTHSCLGRKRTVIFIGATTENPYFESQGPCKSQPYLPTAAADPRPSATRALRRAGGQRARLRHS